MNHITHTMRYAYRLLVLCLVFQGLHAFAQDGGNEWRADAGVLARRIERLSAAGEVDAAATVLRELLARDNIRETGLDDRARMALAQGYLKAQRTQEALAMVEGISWADKSPQKAAEIVSLQLLVRWQGLVDANGLLVSGAIPPLNSEEAPAGKAEGIWLQRWKDFNSLHETQRRGMRMVKAEGGEVVLPAPEAIFALAIYSRGGMEWTAVEATAPVAGWTDETRLQAFWVRMQDHEMEQAFALAEPVLQKGSDSPQAQLMFRELRTWQLHRLRMKERLYIWSYPHIEEKLDGMAGLFPQIEAEVIQELNKQADLHDLVLAQDMAKIGESDAAMLEMPDESLPQKTDDFEVAVYDEIEVAQEIGRRYQIAEEYPELQIASEKAEYSVKDTPTLILDSIHRGEHEISVYRLADATHWHSLRTEGKREILPESPILRQTVNLADWANIGEPARETIKLEPLPEGFYAITATGRGCPVYKLAGFTVAEPEMRLVAGADRILAWVVSRSTGRARAEEPVEFVVQLIRDLEAAGGDDYANATPAWQAGFREAFTGNEEMAYRSEQQNQEFAAGRAAGSGASAQNPPFSLTVTEKTGDNGLAVLMLPERLRGQSYHACARIARPEVSVCDTVRFGEAVAWENRAVAWADKPYVRPGETVRYKAVVRDFDGEEFRLPTQPVLVRLLIEDTVIDERSLMLDETGAIEGTYTIAPGTNKGRLMLRLNEGKPLDLGVVEDLRLPPVRLEFLDDCLTQHVRSGENAYFRLRLTDQAGQPLPGIHIMPGVRVWAHGADIPSNQPEETTTDMAGEAQFIVPTAAGIEATYRLELYFESGTSEHRKMRRWISWRTVAFPFPLEVDLARREYVVGDLIPLLLRLPEGASVRAFLADGKNNRIGGETIIRGNGDKWVETRLSVTEAGAQAKRLVLSAPTLDGKGAQRIYSLSIAPRPTPGVSSRLQLTLLRDRIEPGNPLSLAIGTNSPGRDALLLGGTRDIHLAAVIALEKPATAFEAPTTGDFAPNLPLRAVAYLPDKGFVESEECQLRVLPVHRLLRVEVRPEREDYRPGELVRAQVLVTDWQGKPVPGASISLGVVNELLYELNRDPTPDLWQYFHSYTRKWLLRSGQREELIQLRGTLWRSIIRRWVREYLDDGRAATMRRRSMRSAGGSKAAYESTKLVELSADNDPTAFWVANLRTDAGGLAEVSFELPAQAAAFRCTARVNDSSAAVLVGEVRTTLLTRLPYRCAISVPQFAQAGDLIPAVVSVFNYEPESAEFRLTLPDGSVRELTVAGRGRESLEVTVRVPESREGLRRVRSHLGYLASFPVSVVRSQTGQEPVRAQTECLVLAPGVERTLTVSRVADQNGKLELPLDLPKGAALSLRILSWPDLQARVQHETENWRSGRDATLAAAGWLLYRSGPVRSENLARKWTALGDTLADDVLRLAAAARKEAAGGVKGRHEGIAGDWICARARTLGVRLSAPRMRGVVPANLDDRIMAAATACLERWPEGALLWENLRAELRRRLDAHEALEGRTLALALDAAACVGDDKAAAVFSAALGRVEWRDALTKVLAALNAPSTAPVVPVVKITNGAATEELPAEVFAQWTGVVDDGFAVQTTPGALVSLTLTARLPLSAPPAEMLPEIIFWQADEAGYVKLPPEAPLWPGRHTMLTIRNPSHTDAMRLSFMLPPLFERATEEGCRFVDEYVRNYSFSDAQLRLLRELAVKDDNRPGAEWIDRVFASLDSVEVPRFYGEWQSALSGGDKAAPANDTAPGYLSFGIRPGQTVVLGLQALSGGTATLSDMLVELVNEHSRHYQLPPLHIALAPGTPLLAPRAREVPELLDALRSTLKSATPEEVGYILEALDTAFTGNSLMWTLQKLDPETDLTVSDLLEHPAAGRPGHWTTVKLRQYIDGEPCLSWQDDDFCEEFGLYAESLCLEDLVCIAEQTRNDRILALSRQPAPVQPVTYRPLSLRGWYEHLMERKLATSDFAGWIWEQELAEEALTSLGYEQTFQGYQRFLSDELGLALDIAPEIVVTQRVYAMATGDRGPLEVATLKPVVYSIFHGSRLGTANLAAHNLMLIRTGVGFRIQKINPDSPEPLPASDQAPEAGKAKAEEELIW